MTSRIHLSVFAIVVLLLVAACGPAGELATGTPVEGTAMPRKETLVTEPSPAAMDTAAAVGTGVAGQPITVVPGSGVPPAGVTVEVQSGKFTKSAPASRTFSMPPLNGSLYLLIHYPNVLSSDQHTSLRARVVSQNGDWQVEAKNPPTGDAFAFGLRGTTVPATLKLQIDGAAGVPAVQFDLLITETLELTADESGETFTLPVGERFVLFLGQEFDWSVLPSDTSIVSRVTNITPVRGSQGVYQANAPGKTELEANGSPPCRQSNPPCSMPNRMLTFTIIVQPRESGGQPVALESLRMLSPNEGWGIGWSPDEKTGGVLKTTDGGATWNQVGPQGVSRQAGLVSFSRDASSAWAASTTGNRGANGSVPVTVWRTRDGGASWQAGKPFTIPGGGPTSLAFVDEQHGWLMAGLGVAAGSMGVAIYQTTDGGASWTQVSLQDGAEGATAQALPLGCLKNGLSFANQMTGFATGTCYGGDPFLYSTQDGGKTWKKQVLPPAPNFDIKQGCQCETRPPRFFSSSEGVLSLQGYAGDKFGAAIYVTHDGGATWVPVSAPVPAGSAAFSALSPTMLWMADQASVFVTNDGKNWTTYKPNLAPGIRDLDLVDAQNGFAIPNDVDANKQPFLWVTSNGGKNWKAVTPVLK